MPIPLYLSMTAAEFAACREFPSHIAWMACHFSSYSTGLINLPVQLPKGALLILNDRTPIRGHDPQLVRKILADTVSDCSCSAVLLDLQQTYNPETAAIAKESLTLPCPVCISEIYAKDLDCPVFLPPVPLAVSPEEYLSPWKGREIWLDAAAESAVFTVTETGCRSHPCAPDGDFPFGDAQLHLHYRTELQTDAVRFYLRRTPKDIAALLSRCAPLGVTTGVGLWQELQQKPPCV